MVPKNSQGHDDLKGKRIYRVPLAQSYAIDKFFALPATEQKQDPFFLTIAGKDGKLPALHNFVCGMYMAYDNVKPQEKLPIDRNADLGELKKAKEWEKSFMDMFGKKEDFTQRVELITKVPADEFIWMKQYDTAIQTRTAPPEPPPELEHLFSDTVFRAYGKSFDGLEHLMQQEMWRHKAQDDLEKRLFGEPEIKDTFNVAGHAFITKEIRLHPVFDDGKAIGIRCDWTPLHPHYTGMKNVGPPKGWHEIKEHPGVFTPDPKTNPQDAEALKKLSYPDHKAQEDVFGDTPIITAQEQKDGYPRTYQDWPHGDALQNKQGPFYYITVPVDYKGDVFRPKDSIRVTNYEITRFRQSTGDMYEPHFMFRPVGVPYPKDFKYTPPKEQSDLRYFRLAGQSEQILKDFEAEKENISKMRRDFVKAVGGSGSYSYQGQKIISVAFDHKVPKDWKSIRQSKKTDRDDDGHFYDVTYYDCEPDRSTKKGREFAKRMRSFPLEPDFKELQARWTPNAPHMPIPQWQYFNDDEKVFYYDTSKIDGDFVPPPDAKELPTAAYQWYSRNKTDIQCGIKPPPMPEELKKQVETLIQDNKKQNPRKPPKPNMP